MRRTDVTENVKLRPEEEARLRALLRRSDALGFAHRAVGIQRWDYPEMKAEVLETLEEMLGEANAQFGSYKRELGLSD
jgi:hemoglobin-like flavoprotein